ncbi:hypothetical protein Q5H93_09890 [Hymenobacter sp. ASUV-10]|uniref:SRPBCC family protein n=1 Tax=Hymenobacter aranciens TaxID=3063996 RepID=A0ABT9B9V1_9BACT|nr:hypothetical protein [Hymenobacter sp. ASUV-10]MDO7875040.1 hypothetical protein [Hymenobacter sp. ASUV-10]
MISRQRIPFVVALGIGLVYALVGRFSLGIDLFGQGGLLSIAFLGLMPIGLGALTAHFTPREASWSWRRVWAPFLVVLLFLVAALLFQLEGLICVIIICPLFLLEAFIGAILYTTLADPLDQPRDKTLMVAGFALLPFVAAPLEQLIAAPDTFRRVENTVVIEAPAAVVWQHIVRVAPIEGRELPASLTDAIGFPRPVEATLSREGVGGVRHATFERGVEFIETVDEWQPLRRLSFSIVPNTATIPPTTFDEHVIVGGRFFDVLRGTYELQPLGPGRTRLVLHSRQRLSTHLNWYAGLWTGWVMSEIQGRILTVLKARCEVARTL